MYYFNGLFCPLASGMILKEEKGVKSGHLFSWITVCKGQLFATIKDAVLASYCWPKLSEDTISIHSSNIFRSVGGLGTVLI